MMKYHENGHRIKECNPNWIHSKLKGTKWFNPNTHKEVITLYGMHLLQMCKDATINIVESEKTAIIAAIAYGHMDKNLWMACGGKKMLTRERLQPLIDMECKIVLYPDHDAIDEWHDIAKKIDYSRLRVASSYIKKNWKKEDGEKADIADILIRILNENKNTEQEALMGECMKNEAFGQLVNQLDLVPISNGKTTRE